MLGCQIKSLRVLLVTVTIGIAAMGYFYQALQYIPQIPCPIVNTTLGSLQGYTAISRDGREYFGFLGIPFAEPPVGNLRFEPPQPAKGWTGVRNARNFGSDCAQMGILLGFIESYEEDCLFLNVYTPARDLKDPNKRFSVMVYFYGGMFMEGKSSIYGPKYFMDEDIVLVTVNYRIGALGFLNTGDGLIRGNMGLKDQNAGLRWVQQNIQFFGGKPEDVTIFGQSAGSASSHYHILSPLSKGLFTKAISQSGVATNPWALTTKTTEQAYRLGNRLNCSTESTQALVKCLKNASVKDILATHTEVLNFQRDPITVYTPTIEVINDSEAFITENPADLLRNGKFSKVPWMTGVTTEEGLVASGMLIRNTTLKNGGFDGWKALAKNGLYYAKENKDLTDEVKQFYFGDAQCIQDLGEKNFFQRLTRLFSDRHFFTGFADAISQHSVHAPTFAYLFNYTGQFTVTPLLLAARGESHIIIEIVQDLISNWYKRIFLGIEPDYHGVCHSDEIFLLFDIFPPFTTIRQSHEDYQQSRTLVKLWTTFAQLHPKGKLSFLGTSWQEVNPKDKPQDINYMLIDNDQVKLAKAPFASRLEFWDTRESRL